MNCKIEKINCRKKIRLAKKIKIIITSGKGRRFMLPGIPFWFLTKIISIALFFTKKSIKKERHKLPVTEKEIYEILKCLRREAPFTLVEVVDRKGNFIEIKTL